MFREMARIDINPERCSDFEGAISEAVPLFLRAKGCTGVTVSRSVERPGRYWLMVQWDSVDDHLIGFRQSRDFQERRRLAGGFFLAPPEVEHLTELDLGASRKSSIA